MPEYLTPGVYVEEVSSGIRPIEGVGTSTGAFIGLADQGAVRTPVLITSWTQFKETFGGLSDKNYLAYAVYQFFNEGGTKCYVVRAAKGTAEKPLKQAEKTINDLTVKASSEGQWGNGIKVKVGAETPEMPGGQPRADYFKLTVLHKELDKYNEVEAFDNLSMDEAKKDHVEKRIPRGSSKWIEVKDNGNARPADGEYELAGGADGVPPDSTDWAGAGGVIYAFDSVDDINVLAIPDAPGDAAVAKAACAYCQNRKDCLFVVDPKKGFSREDVLKLRGDIGLSEYGALYYPWIEVADPLSASKKKMVPPSGAVVGTYSHTDVARGVHKAPAGIEDGFLNSAIGVERYITTGEQDTLNPVGVNVIRSFPGVGGVVWGARTLADKTSEFKYVNVRRLMMFIEESLDEGTQWVVFEPNSPILWGRVKRNITAFLTRVWRDGALFGTTAAEAFFVKVDAENNPPEVVDAGQLVIEVGVAPVKPAEFVIIRISQKTQGKAA